MKTIPVPDVLTQTKKSVAEHPLFSKITGPEQLKIFMDSHVYAVWDFMSLLKSLQRSITCVELPWRPSPYSKSSVRFINEIVVGEESDLGSDERPIDHFSMYLEAMQEVGASTSRINEFLATLDYSLLPENIAPFVSYNIDLAINAPVHKVAGAFFFGREDLIPTMFEQILSELGSQNIDCPKLKHYLARHIELDGDEHGPLAMALLHELTGGDEVLLNEAFATGLESLKLRHQLWSSVEAQIDRA
tara:strand:- start:15014 stop:15751 length:738 start_codon:yes stop_codon:yes gene_type:complete